ncbi:MAG TPA: hypothetical protein PLN21_04135 [Gemmatales bacterium]|nr:hypothetical protein [Gemmatales bacterium]
MNDGNNLAANPFGMMLIQTGSMIGALVMGLGAVAGSIVAALKSRGTGPKSNRIKEYLNPDTLPAIPPSPKTTRKETEQPGVKPSKIDQQSVHEQLSVGVKPVPTMMQPDEPMFEDFDR